MAYRRQELLTCREHLGSPPGDFFSRGRGLRVAHLISCVVLFFYSFIFVLCHVYIASVFVLSILDCTFCCLLRLFTINIYIVYFNVHCYYFLISTHLNKLSSMIFCRFEVVINNHIYYYIHIYIYDG